MREQEAATVAGWVKSLGLAEGAVCLNIGSSTGDFRARTQPHIDRLLIKPIEAAGIRVVHCDLKPAPGVDEVGDLLDPAFRAKLKTYNADLILCSNLLEHLRDPRTFAHACGELPRPGGYGVFTVPQSYPYHPDPIDTYLRPTPRELAAMLPGWEVEKAETIRGGNHWDDLRKSGKPWSRLGRQAVRAALPVYRPTQWRHVAHRLLWLNRPFTVSAVLLRKPEA